MKAQKCCACRQLLGRFCLLLPPVLLQLTVHWQVFVDDGTKAKVKFVNGQGKELLAEVDASVLPPSMGGSRAAEDRLVTGSDGDETTSICACRVVPLSRPALNPVGLRDPVCHRVRSSILVGDGQRY